MHQSPESSGELAPNPPQAERLLRLPQVLSIVGLSTSRLYELIAGGEFTSPVKVGRTSLWPASEVHAWVARQVAASRRKGGA